MNQLSSGFPSHLIWIYGCIIILKTKIINKFKFINIKLFLLIDEFEERSKELTEQDLIDIDTLNPSLNNVMQYIEQNNCLNDDDLNSLFTLKQRLDEIRESNIILPTIDRFFKKD